MAVETRLPLEVNSLDTATPIRQANIDQNNNALSSEQILKAHYENMNEREKSRLSSTVAGAAQLKSFLDNNDVNGATDFLNRRRATLQQRMGNGENIDTQETDYALDALKNGKVDELKNDVNGLLAAGQVYGIVDKPRAADVAGGDTGVLLDRLVAEKRAGGQKDYSLEDALRDLKGGAGQAGRNDANIATGFDANYQTQGGKNASDVETAGLKGFNENVGKNAGQQVITNNNTLTSLDSLRNTIGQARSLLPKVSMTGPLAGRAGSLAEDPDYKNLQGAINAITLQAKDLYNLGSGQGFSDADRDFLRQVIAGDYARAETIQGGLDRLDSALVHRQQYLENQNKQYQQGNYNYNTGQAAAPGAQTQQGSGGQKVRVTDGKDTFDIDPSDLGQAQADGFRQLQ